MVVEIKEKILKIMNEKKDQNLNIRLSKSVKDILLEMSNINKMTMNLYVINLIIEDYIEFKEGE